VGQVCELGLDVYDGRPCSVPNGWKGLLEGRPIKPPLPARKFLVEAAEPSPIQFFQANRRGEFQPTPIDGLDMWRR
jgi:hypothetical protein